MNGKRLSYKSICQDAKLTKRNYAKIKTGDNKSIYAYYAVFRIYLHALLERPNRRLLLMVLKALYEALESDFETRKKLNRK